MYKVRKSDPPKARLRGTSGTLMTPRRLPAGSTTQMPPDPVQKTRPSMSTFIPSGTPGSAEDISANTLLLLILPSAATSNARISLWWQISFRSSSWRHRSSRRLMAT